MKKQLLSILGSVLFAFSLSAQTNIANYTFASTAGTYVPITGGTTYLTSWDAQVSGNIPLGGTFTFGGVNYTSVNIYANGYITFGAGPSYVTPLSNGAFNGVISAFGQDGNSSLAPGASPKIIYKNIGGATGEFVVQYTDHANFYNKATERLNFQIRLNLATDVIKIVYGSWTNAGSSVSGTNAQVGIRGNSTNWATNVNSLYITDIPVGTTCPWDRAVTSFTSGSSMLFSNINNNVKPTNGLTLTWTPPVNPSLMPVRVLGATTNVTSNSADLTWTPSAGATQYYIQYRPNSNCFWSNFTGNPVTTNSVTLTGLNPNTTYKIRVQASDGTNKSIWSHVPDITGTGDGYDNVNGTFITTALTCTTTPFAGTISGPTNVLDGSNSSYTVSPAVGNIQWYGSYNPQGPWSPIASATLATNQSIEAIGSGTVYYIAVASSPACVDDTTNTPYMVDIQATAYCQPAPSSVDGDGIINVNIKNGVINNTTGLETNNYGDYTSLIANVNQGVNVPVAITFSTDIYDYNTKIWVDFNNDFDFNDIGEEVFSGVSAATSPNTLTAVVYIPVNAPLGNHVMRIGAADENIPDPCYTGDYGTFEDYTINVLGAPACTLTPVAGTISGPASANESSTNIYSVSPSAGQLQWYSSNVGPTGPWMAISGATMANQPIVAVASGSVYYTVVAYSPGCVKDTATALLTVITKTAYCVPSPSFVDADGITNVNINNGSVNNTTGAESGNYGNYTTLVANTNQGANMPLSITFSTQTAGTTYAYNTKVWIDFNDDFDFDDAGEEVFSGVSGTVSPNTLTTTINIASNAQAGTHVMRIGAVWSATPTPCYTGGYGAYEDYSINIAAVSCTPTPTSVDGSGIVNVDINNGAINNPSGDEAPAYYGNYTGLIANVNQGVNVPVAITFSTLTYDYNTNIWIDFNNNGDFTDAGENVYSGLSSTTSPNTLTAVVYIPLTASLGNHVMRIGAADEVSPDPCYTGDFATFEDYTLNILAAPACTLTPNVGVISGPSSVTLGSTNTYSVSGAAGQLQWYSSSNANGPWTAISSATMNTTNVSATTSGTFYFAVVAYNPGCVNDTTNSFMSVVTETAYCVPSPVFLDGDGIVNVDINSGLVNNSSGSEPGNYGDYTSLVANVNAGSTVPVAITFSTNGYAYNTKIWVDFNNDLDFTDLGEEVYSGTSSTVIPNTLNATINIPVSATPGNHVMRIGAVESNTPTPCYSDYYGTYEDYSLNVVVPTCSPSPTSVDGEGIVNVDINNGAINNPSLAETNNYGNYTSLIANVYQGVNMPVAITFSTDIYDYNTRIWIDFNNDGDFIDSGELVYTGVSASTSPNTLNAVVSIPFSAPLGNHVIRIGATDAGTPTPCYNGSYGTYEDYTINIQTPPPCTLTPAVGVITGSTSVNSGSINSYTVSPAIGNIQWYSSTNANGPWTMIPSATVAVGQTITATGSGIVYYTAVASGLGCLNDTVNTPIAVNVTYLGNDVCSAIPLSLGASPKYNLYGATVEAGEVRPPNTGFETNTGWGNSNITNTMWFTFLAPASGNVSIQAPSLINGGSNDSQLAIWDAANCTDLIGQATPTAPVNATLIAANDDDTAYVANNGTIYSSYVRASCLTPGVKYFIQLDTYFTASSGDSTQIIITDLGAFDASFSGPQPLQCLSNTSTSLTPVNNGGVFTLNGSTTPITSFTPNTIGTYTITYAINGCKTQSVTNVVAGPTVNITPSNNSVCGGFSALLTGSGATSYTWLPSGNNGTSETATPSVTTTYTLLGNNSGGCVANALFTLSVTPLPSVMISATSTTICPNSTATLSAVSSASVFTWSDGSTTADIVITPTVSTDYSVTAINSCGSSTGTISITISNIVNVTATTSNTLLCSGQTAILTANGATTYTWMPMGTVGQTVSVAPSSPTTYTLLGQSSCGSATSTITQNVSLCTDVNNITSLDVMSLYPNPNYGVLHVSLNRVLEGTTIINVIDALGKTVITERLTEQNTIISTSQLEAGIYFYEVINENNKLQKGKIIKQ